MELMEDGNLMDKVSILIQRDMDYYRENQTILQESICQGIVGGRLDFPRFVSFASMKLVLWWEDEYVSAYRKQSGFLQKKSTGNLDDETHQVGCGGVVKSSDPQKFSQAVTNSAKDLLNHLHVLTQEALDHADLTVLTGTIGASSLLKNCLWYFQQTVEDSTLQETYKKYIEMEEALAERLLDLHIRLLSLYILQDSECLDWENPKPFFEQERGSYVIQMWYLYMRGTQDNLWQTVPPKMAQRVFLGMLNESLTILTVRYNQALPSEARTKLMTNDLANLLQCIAQLFPSVCDGSEEFLGICTKSKIVRDIHVKCEELLNCLVFRSVPLEILGKSLRKLEIPERNPKETFSWLSFVFPNLSDLKLELVILLRNPQPNWSLLARILTMQRFELSKLIIKVCIENSKEILMQESNILKKACGKFLCNNTQCASTDPCSEFYTEDHFFQLLKAVSFAVFSLGEVGDILELLIRPVCQNEEDGIWCKCLEKKNVWNQIKPAWFVAMTDLVKPLLQITVKTTIDAVKTGASMYQATSIVLVCFSYFWDVLDTRTLSKLVRILEDLLPANVTPLGHSILLQIQISALYTELINNKGDDSEISSALAEALCSIDEDNKHTDQIEDFLDQTKEKNLGNFGCGDLLLGENGRESLKTLYGFLSCNEAWIFHELGNKRDDDFDMKFRVKRQKETLLYSMFHIGEAPFDQVLTGKRKFDYEKLIENCLPKISIEKISEHVHKRWEFRDPISSPWNLRDVQAISSILSHFIE